MSPEFPKIGIMSPEFSIVRYADDLTILCRNRVDKPLEMLKYVLGRCDLRLNDKKTTIVNARKESFDFLGFSFRMRLGRRSGKLYPHIEPSKRSVTRIKARVKELTNRRRTPVPVPDIIYDVNEVIRGWSAYFHYKHSTKVLKKVKRFTEERLRKHLSVRYKIKSRTG